MIRIFIFISCIIFLSSCNLLQSRNRGDINNWPESTTAIPTPIGATQAPQADIDEPEDYSKTPHPAGELVDIIDIDPDLQIEGGQIWIWKEDGEESNLLIDIESGEIIKYATGNGCTTLIPLQHNIYCLSSYGEVYLENPLTGEIQYTSVINPMWVNFSTNGIYFAYEIYDGDQEIYTISVYDINNEVSNTIAKTDQDYWSRNWIGVPSISSDGEHLLVARNEIGDEANIFEITGVELNYREIGDGFLSTSGDIAWSPDGGKFIYGASDVISEVLLPPNLMILRDIDQKQPATILEATPEMQYYLLKYDFLTADSIWSPDGERLFLSTFQHFCILEVLTLSYRCEKLPDDNTLASKPTWSPSGKFIAFLLWPSKLVVYSLSDQTYYVIYQNEDMYSIKWR